MEDGEKTLSACHARQLRDAGAVQVTTTVSASSEIVKDDPRAEHELLGMHRTATSGCAPDVSRGAPMLTTPIPSVGGFQDPRGDGSLRILGSGVVAGLETFAGGTAGLLGLSLGGVAGADVAALGVV
jgi:hypothetical protein